MSLIMIYFLRNLSLYGLSNDTLHLSFLFNQRQLVCLNLPGEQSCFLLGPARFQSDRETVWKATPGTLRHRLITVLMVRLDQGWYSYARVRDAVFA